MEAPIGPDSAPILCRPQAPPKPPFNYPLPSTSVPHFWPTRQVTCHRLCIPITAHLSRNNSYSMSSHLKNCCIFPILFSFYVEIRLIVDTEYSSVCNWPEVASIDPKRAFSREIHSRIKFTPSLSSSTYPDSLQSSVYGFKLSTRLQLSKFYIPYGVM
jgi:hypothetical protein